MEFTNGIFKNLIGFLFLEQFWVHSRIEFIKHRVSLYTPPPTHTQPLPLSASHQSGPFVPISTPTLKRHYHPEPVGYLRVPSRCCTFRTCFQTVNLECAFPALKIFRAVSFLSSFLRNISLCISFSITPPPSSLFIMIISL